MSFRRQALLEAGGFRHELGRIGKIPAGCEETDLCIRVGQQQPGREIVYDPEAAVDHFVPAERASLEYFTSRCRGEGRSKAILAGLVGSDDGLSEERSYIRRTLPLGFLRGIGDAFRGDVDGLARAAMLVVGLGDHDRRLPRRPAARPGGSTPRARERGRSDAAASSLRVLMVTPRSPLAQGGVERHVMETSRRIAASGRRGRGALHRARRPGRRGAGARRGDDPHRPRLARRPRLVPGAAALARDVAPALGRRPRPVLPHAGGAAGDAAGADPAASPTSSPSTAAATPQAHRNRARGAQRRLLRPLLRRAARLVAVARFEIDEYGGELGLPPENFALIPNGTDLAFAETGAAPAAATAPRRSPRSAGSSATRATTG